VLRALVCGSSSQTLLQTTFYTISGRLNNTKFEGWLAPKPPWTASKMTAGRLDAMKKAIVGLVMSVDEVEGSFKLNQHKSEPDYAAVAAALDSQTDADAQQIARLMREARPSAFANATNPLERSVP
jgi:transcriptional regulator